MPCFTPLQAFFSVREDGKKDISFSNFDWFSKGLQPLDSMLIPCGRCMGCRLERSRQWALRCVHEAKLYEDNCFLTLTYRPECLPVDGSLCKKHVQDFMKRLRFKYSDKKIRVFYCGEYGENFSRPHYHLCIFNFDFLDKIVWKKINGFTYYTSVILDDLWNFGFSTISDLTFDSAAYVARYCTKKIVGSAAADHYLKVDPVSGFVSKVVPEFVGMSLKPGIGAGWFEKYGVTDVFPTDTCLINGAKCKPPRYYDVLRDRIDPKGFARAKEARRVRGESKSDDNTYDRLATKLKCQEARFNKLIRKMEI